MTIYLFIYMFVHLFPGLRKYCCSDLYDKISEDGSWSSLDPLTI